MNPEQAQRYLNILNWFFPEFELDAPINGADLVAKMTELKELAETIVNKTN